MSENYQELCIKYGEPIRQISKFFFQANQQFFAELLVLENPLRFVGKQWFVYSGKHWQPCAKVYITKIIAKLLCRFADEFGFPEFKSQINNSLLSGIEKIAQTFVYISMFPVMDWRLIPCQNVVLRWNGEIFTCEKFAPELNIRSLLTVNYDPEADYEEFKQLFYEILSPEDVRLLQLYLGIALLTINLTENFLLLQGVGGSSKSLLLRLLAEILGDNRVFDLNIKALGRDFELSGLDAQTLLVASEATGDALCSGGAQFIKKMVGGDKFQARVKYENEKRQLCGNYSLVIVSNEDTLFHYEGSGEEWRRRILPVFFLKPHKKVIKGLVGILLTENGSGILNWLLEGAAEVLRNKWQIELTPAQEIRRDRLIARSEPVRLFVEHSIELSAGDDFTSEEAYQRYCTVARDSSLPILTREAFFKQFSAKMAEVFPEAISSSSNNLRRYNGGQNKKTCRGYRGYKLKELARI
ncbi:MAG: hypothetical protein PHV82_04650 [Victivallaceae bacterium]|nr:hypothetical protein [Victivallaceae bacterium]